MPKVVAFDLAFLASEHHLLVAAAFRLPHDGDLKVAATSTGQRDSLKHYYNSDRSKCLNYSLSTSIYFINNLLVPAFSGLIN